jgi:hypothetical protein
MGFKLQFDGNRIGTIASRYDFTNSEQELIERSPVIQKRGYLLKLELQKLAYWKAARSAGHVKSNSEEYIQEITGFSLKANSERSRIEILTLLDGVSWPTASVILHFFHKDPYPILDFRALWTVSMDVPSQYRFDFWWSYVEYCRKIATKYNVDMRTLDMALWQYSKENQ